jgi:hypothetical protein
LLRNKQACYDKARAAAAFYPKKEPHENDAALRRMFLVALHFIVSKFLMVSMASENVVT